MKSSLACAAAAQETERGCLFARSVQTNIGARQVLCVDSGVGVCQPKTACVSTINIRHAPCLGKQASRLTVTAKARVYHQCLRRCVSLTHFTQPVPLCCVMAFLCYDIIQGAHAHVRPCMFWYVRVHPLHTDADSTAERPTSSAELCWHAPTWQRGLFFFNSPWGENRFFTSLG